jgi:hypothetical protein
VGNRVRRREQAERRQRRRAAAKVVGVVLLVAIVAGGAWMLLRGDDEEVQGWTLADVRVQLIRPDDPGADAFAGRGFRVMFDADWRGSSEEPPRRALPCRLEVRDAGGELVHETEFGLYVGTGSAARSWNPNAIPDTEVDGTPAEAELTCEEAEGGSYAISNLVVVRGWHVSFEARWTGEGEPEIEACEIWLVREDDPGAAVYEQPIAMAPRLLGEREEFPAYVDQMTLPPDDAVVECDPEALSGLEPPPEIAGYSFW